jgi:hypothetical protein
LGLNLFRILVSFSFGEALLKCDLQCCWQMKNGQIAEFDSPSANSNSLFASMVAHEERNKVNDN